MFLCGPYMKIKTIENDGHPPPRWRQCLPFTSVIGFTAEGELGPRSWGRASPPSDKPLLFLTQSQVSGKGPSVHRRPNPAERGAHFDSRNELFTPLFPSKKKGRLVTTVSNQTENWLHVHCLLNSLLH